MKKERKYQIADEIRDKLAVAQSVIAVDFKGTSVAQAQEIRKELRREGASFQVVKNTLLRKAVAGTQYEALAQLTGGQVAIAWSETDPGYPAKVLVKLTKTISSLRLKGAVLSGRLLDAQGVIQLAQLPSRDELRGKLLSVLIAVPQQFLGVLGAAQRDFVGVLKAREDKLKGAA